MIRRPEGGKSGPQMVDGIEILRGESNHGESKRPLAIEIRG